MDLLSIPPEVIDAYVLPFLEWNDLLRLRRVCKWSKDIVDGYLKVNPELAPEIEIDEEDKTFAAFLEMGIPTSKIFLNNRSGYDFYRENREDLVSFLEEFGPLIRSLRVDQISITPFGKELDFLDGLKNLESLVAESLGGFGRGMGVEEMLRLHKQRESLVSKDPRIARADGKNNFPTEYYVNRLKTLKIGNFVAGAGVLDQFEINYLYIKNGIQLTTVALPFNPNAKPRPDSGFENLLDFEDRPMALAFAIWSHGMASRWQKKIRSGIPSFKEIDFHTFHNRGNLFQQFQNEITGSEQFLFLCYAAHLGGVKLMNVGSGWFMGIKIAHDPPQGLGTPVVSLINIHPCAISLDMPNLERLEIQSTLRSSPGTNWRVERADWPALRSLKIIVDSRVGECPEPIIMMPNEAPQRYMPNMLHSTSTKELFGFLFENVSRTAMTDLHLEFFGVPEDVTIPNVDSIVSACPNLKRLTLNNWLGTNKALTKLWSGLPGLEEISLEYCKALGNVAFVGEDVGAPVFLKLQRLRKLTLKGLDQMPKVTNTLFSLVIRHLKLTHLILTSDSPVKSITAGGIRSLCDGGFAESIEKFPFKNWSLSDMSAEEFKKLEAMFRSSNML